MLSKQKYFNEFLKAPLSSFDRNYLEESQAELLETDHFAGFPSFGTGGMRHLVELGTNRLNEYNIARLSLCVANWLGSNFPVSHNPRVIVGYDSRNTSRKFSQLVYHLFKSIGFDVSVFKRPTPTPLISFAVRELKAQAGVILTASHNPPQYNGYKLMASNGGQIISPHDEKIQGAFLSFSYESIPQDIHEWKSKAPDPDDVIEEEIISAYVARIKKESFVRSVTKSPRVFYSPLYGTGGWAFERVFCDLGYNNFQILKEQAEPDGNFPGLKSPNPEDESAFQLLKKEANGADILVATDPDADRIGVCLLGPSDYIFLTGNQVGCLLLEFLARGLSEGMSDPYACKTIVTTELQKRIAEDYGIRMIETLTGFKYIADMLEKDPDNYLFGGEESLGYLPVNWIRDKDSISSAVALTELACFKDPMSELRSMYIRYGLYHEELYNIELSESGLLLLDQMKTDFLNQDLFLGKKLGSREVIDHINLNAKSAQGGHEPITEEGKKLYHSLPLANVLQLWLNPEGRVTLRPSGTEPKIKIYLSMKYKDRVTKRTLSSSEKKLKEEIKVIAQDFIDLIGIQYKIS